MIKQSKFLHRVHVVAVSNLDLPQHGALQNNCFECIIVSSEKQNDKVELKVNVLTASVKSNVKGYNLEIWTKNVILIYLAERLYDIS